MAATQQDGQDRIVSTGSSESHNILAIDTEEKSTSAENLKGQTLTPKDERMVPPSVPHGATFVSPSRNITGQPESLGTGGYPNTVYPPNVYAPQAQPLYFGTGYDNAGGGERDEYTQYLNAEGMELVSPGIYNDNSSLVFHAGYGYTPQMPYGPYSPVTTPIPSVRGDGQMYSPQQFPFAGPYYPQSVPPSMSYITSSTPVSQPDLSISTPIDPQGLDSFGSGGPWSDWSKSQDGQRSLALFSSPAASPQPLATLGPFSHNTAPLPAGMGSQQQRQMYGFGSTTNSYNRGYMHGGTYQGTHFDGSVSGLGANGRSWITDKSNRRRGRGSGSLCNCNGTLDVLNEQNRGPRALRSKNPTRDSNSSVDAKNNDATLRTRNDLYNRSDFATDYKDAKFFIIKSYSEDNVHKSIKYGVWASTANGNRKLDAAYHVAKDIHPPCPVFLFFSVNASAQFCGVAEMLGPVDFDKSVDYWQQDKWSGQFPVKWHIIKDVPNSQFRHIILDNNDNKPVTNSRDTQEVKLDQGLQILSIFKNYESDQSILDDFEYYEDREKIMQERKAKQQASLTAGPAVTSHEHRSEGPPGDIIKRMSKSFAQAVRLEESSKEDSLTEKGVPTSAEANQPEGVTKTTGTA